MQITAIYGYLVHPSKNQEEKPGIQGTSVPLEGDLFEMLSDIFNKATTECNIDIAFKAAEDGTQNNICRSEFIKMLTHSSVDMGRSIAERLQAVTTRRSGLGLLFIIIGTDEANKRLCISRFPANIGIVAQEDDTVLHVELLEQVFMKNTTTYKAVVLEGENFNSDFWIGKAIDKQINDRTVTISNYWIREFLHADFRTTSAQGTRRLAIAIKKTIEEESDLQIKEELAAAARLAQALDRRVINANNFGEQFCLSEKTTEALSSRIGDTGLDLDQFEFSAKEFSKHIQYRSLLVSNGALLTAPVDQFESCFRRTKADVLSSEYVFTTQGEVVNESLHKKLR